MELWGLKIIEKTIYWNCSAFFKIHDIKETLKYIEDGGHLYQDQQKTIELLDGTRIHPESYNVAKKICRDAMEENEDVETCIEKILLNPQLLKEMQQGIEQYAQY